MLHRTRFHPPKNSVYPVRPAFLCRLSMLSKSMFAFTPRSMGCSEFIYCSPSSDSGRHSRNGSRGFFSFSPRVETGLEPRVSRVWEGVCKLPVSSLLFFFFVSVPCLMLDKLNEMIGDLFGDRGGRDVLFLINSTITK